MKVIRSVTKALRSWYFWIWILSLIILVVLGLYTTRNQSISGCVECKYQSGNHFYFYTCNGTEYPISKDVWVSLNSSECNGISSTSCVSVNDLELSLSLNSTTLQLGQEVSIIIDEQNTLSVANNVSSSQNWPLNGSILGPCGALNYPFGVAIFQGYYSSTNVSTATPLVIYNPTGIFCPAEFVITSYGFQPSSDVAAIFGGCDSNPCYTTEIHMAVNVTGYWTGSPVATLTNFDPGVYTVVGEDEWGALTVLHFLVPK